jgi:hypothetical protein
MASVKPCASPQVASGTELERPHGHSRLCERAGGAGHGIRPLRVPNCAVCNPLHHGARMMPSCAIWRTLHLMHCALNMIDGRCSEITMLCVGCCSLVTRGAVLSPAAAAPCAAEPHAADAPQLLHASSNTQRCDYVMYTAITIWHMYTATVSFSRFFSFGSTYITAGCFSIANRAWTVAAWCPSLSKQFIECLISC